MMSLDLDKSGEMGGFGVLFLDDGFSFSFRSNLFAYTL
jgi:hypothetical protein